MEKDKRYQKICQTSDEILLKDLNDTTIANNSLNIIKEHPHLLEIYKNIHYKNIFSNFIKHAFSYTYYYIIYIKNRLFSALVNRKDFRLSKKKIDVLIISHLLDKKLLNKKDDFYFGEFEKDVKRRKLSCFKILINHTRLKTFILKNNKSEKRSIFILPQNLCLFDELRIDINLFKYFFKYFLLSFKIRDNFKRKIYFLVAVEFLNRTTKANIIIKKNLEKYFNNIKIKNLITTFEGFSWERLVFSFAKSNYPKMNRIGYQFAALTKFQHSINRSLSTLYDPDIIWCSGKNTRKILLKNKNKKKIIPIGSNRYITNNNIIRKNFLSNIKCLVVPEAMKSECASIFNFSLICAEHYPQIKFIWRLHPLLDFDYLKSINIIPSRIPKNIILSKKRILDDIKNCNFCFYRGSTSIITALQFGLHPVYLNLNQKLNIDPIFSMNHWKTKINNLKDFDKLISYDYKKIMLSQNKKKAMKFAKQYFMKFNANKALQSLN